QLAGAGDNGVLSHSPHNRYSAPPHFLALSHKLQVSLTCRVALGYTRPRASCRPLTRPSGEHSSTDESKTLCRLLIFVRITLPPRTLRRSTRRSPGRSTPTSAWSAAGWRDALQRCTWPNGVIASFSSKPIASHGARRGEAAVKPSSDTRRVKSRSCNS